MEHLCNKNHEFNNVLVKKNKYFNNSKFISIVDNVSILQLSPSPFYTAENLPRVYDL